MLSVGVGVVWFKLRRELKRVQQQILAVWAMLYEPFVRFRHDKTRARTLVVSEGALVCIPLSQVTKVAIVLIFQPRGVPDSVVRMCAHLADIGFLPLVVSNAPLGVDDLSLLHPVMWRAVVRPNFGYDFGGYRDGIFLLSQWGVSPDVLVVVNDSIWFPLTQESDFIERMMAQPADFVGAFELGGVRTFEPHGSAPRRRFFGSFFWLFKKPALEHPAFQDFWRTYRMTSHKYSTIKRGEELFSKTMFEAGIRSVSMLSAHHLDVFLDSASAADTLHVLAHLATRFEVLERARSACVQDYVASELWRSRAVDVIRQITLANNILFSAPVFCAEVCAAPFAKKSVELPNVLALRRLVDSAQSLGLAPAVAQEMRALID